MAQIHRWWLRYGWQLCLVLVGIYCALVLRLEHSMAIAEIYEFFSRPFHGDQPEYLENARIQELQARITELENHNQQLAKLLQIPSSPVTASQWAPIIGRSGDAWWQQVLIGKGKQEGIAIGDLVEGEGGLVGRVTNVGDHTSQVLLISDSSSQVGVMVSRSRVMGILKGKNQSTGMVEFFVRDADVKVGDIVVTSPMSSLFPRGIPVGKIRSVDINKQPAPEAVVEFSAPLGLLEYVRVSRR